MNYSIIPNIASDCQPLDAALAASKYRIPVFPCAPGGKTPITPQGFKDATADEELIRAWWRSTPNANVAMPTGLAVDVIDIDAHKGGSLEALEALTGPLGPTYTVRTPHGGLHLYFLHARGVTNARGGLPQAVDCRGSGGYILLPPSIVDGSRYEVLDANPIAEMPDALFDLLTGSRTRQRAVQRVNVTATTSGAIWVARAVGGVAGGSTRNETGFWLACQLRDSGLSQENATHFMDDYHRQVESLGDHGYAVEEAYKSLRSAYSQPPREPAKVSQFGTVLSPLEENTFNDDGNARRFAVTYSDRLRHVTGLGWVAYQDGRWVKNAGKLAQEWARECLRSMATQAAGTALEEKVYAHVSRSLNAYRIAGMLKLAESDPRMSASVDDFDREPYLLNVANGTLDLRDGSLHDHDAKDMLTHICPVDYEPNARSGLWEHFLSEVFQGDAGLVDYAQRALGYSITGETSEQVMFICHGRGANGKSTLLEAVKSVLGDYATGFPDTGLEKKTFHNGATAEPEMVATVGARMALVAEWPEGGALDTRKVKAVTGGDTLMIRNLYQAPFEYKPTFKLWVRANERPKIDERTEGIWRRLRLVPFEASFTGRQDKTLPQRLREESPAILAWLVKGAVDFYASGLLEADAVKDATEGYRSEEDPLGLYLAKRLVSDPTASVRVSDVYADYQRWRTVNEDAPYVVDVAAFGKLLRSHGMTPKRRTAGMTLVGWCLSPHDDVGNVGDLPNFSCSGSIGTFGRRPTSPTSCGVGDEAEAETVIW